MNKTEIPILERFIYMPADNKQEIHKSIDYVVY